eukprot:Ihof_evm2s377 gene=Ihof_evmTU2s377
MGDETAESLLRWIQQFKNISEPVTDWTDVSDGVALYEIMAEIEPRLFDKALLKYGVRTNARLRMTNVSRLLNSLLDYYAEEFSQSAEALEVPDAAKVATGVHTEDTVLLAKLVLGAAVFSARKEEYIAAILRLDEPIQIALMAVIQQMMARYPALMVASSTEGPEGTHSHDLLHSEGQAIGLEMEELRTALAAAREDLQRERQEVAHLQETVHILQGEKQVADARIKSLENYEDEDTPSGKVLTEVRTTCTQLEERLFSMESDRDMHRRECHTLKQELEDLKRKYIVSQETAEQALQYRDEGDLLRREAERVPILEKALEVCKAKIQDMAALKLQVEDLEKANAMYIERSLELEDQLRRVEQQRDHLDSERLNVVSLTEDQCSMALDLKQALELVKDLKKQRDCQESNRLEQEDLIRSLKDHIHNMEDSSIVTATSGSRSPSSLLSVQLDGDRGKINQLEREISVLRAKCQRLEEEMAGAERSPSIILNEHKGAGGDNGMNDMANGSRLLEVQQQLADMTNQYNKILAEAGGKEAKEVEYLGQVNGLLMENRQLISENGQWKEDFDLLTMKHQELKGTYTSLKEGFSLLQTRFQKFQQQGIDGSIQQHLQRLQNQLLEKDAELHAFKAAVEAKEALWMREQQLVATAVYSQGLDIQRMAMAERLPGK